MSGKCEKGSIRVSRYPVRSMGLLLALMQPAGMLLASTDNAVSAERKPSRRTKGKGLATHSLSINNK